MLTIEERGYHERTIRAMEALAKSNEAAASAFREAAEQFRMATEAFRQSQERPAARQVTGPASSKPAAKPAPAALPAGEIVLSQVTALVDERIRKYGDAARATDKQYNLWRAKVREVLGIDGGRLVTAILAEMHPDEMTKTWRPSMSACAAWLDWMLTPASGIKPEAEAGLHALLALAQRENDPGNVPPWDR